MSHRQPSVWSIKRSHIHMQIRKIMIQISFRRSNRMTFESVRCQHENQLNLTFWTWMHTFCLKCSTICRSKVHFYHDYIVLANDKSWQSIYFSFGIISDLCSLAETSVRMQQLARLSFEFRANNADIRMNNPIDLILLTRLVNNFSSVITSLAISTRR